MKRYIIIYLLILVVKPSIAQIAYVNNDSAEFNKAKIALNTIINVAAYIVEAKSLEIVDYYYIKDEDQTYNRGLIKVTNVLKAPDIKVGDTLIIMWKQEYKGNGPDEHRLEPSHQTAPRLWYIEGQSTSCLFLTDSKYPVEPVPDAWSHLKHTFFIPSSIGYFAALYIRENLSPEVSLPNGMKFAYRYEWYQYLRQFPDLKVPENY